jgi:hypothetical protein
MRTLHDHLIKSYGEGRQVVVLIDEAHAMPTETLEEIRLLSNLESNRSKLLQLVLFGQPELNDILARPDMRQLKERITHNFGLEPLVREDIGHYLDFRMRAAGYRGPSVFAPPALKLIEQSSLGLTRRINILADKALLAAFSSGSHQIGAKEAQAAIRDCEFSDATYGGGRPTGRARLRWVGAALVVCVLAGAAWLILSRTESAAPALQPPPRQFLSAQPSPAFSGRRTATPPLQPASNQLRHLMPQRRLHGGRCGACIAAGNATCGRPAAPIAASGRTTDGRKRTGPRAAPPSAPSSNAAGSSSVGGRCRNRPDACPKSRHPSPTAGKTSQSKVRATHPRTARSRSGLAGTVAGRPLVHPDIRHGCQPACGSRNPAAKAVIHQIRNEQHSCLFFRTQRQTALGRNLWKLSDKSRRNDSHPRTVETAAGEQTLPAHDRAFALTSFSDRRNWPSSVHQIIDLHRKHNVLS